MIVPAAVFGIFGLASIAGGVLGYRKVGSRASLIAGGASGVLLLVASGLLSVGAASSGLILGGVVSALLAGRFVPAFTKNKTWMPHGMMAALSTIGVVTAVAARLIG